MTHPTSPQAHPATPGNPTPTSGRENSQAMWWVIGMVALAVVAVLGFNLLGPRGDASRKGTATPPSASSGGMAPAMPSASSPAQAGSQGPAQAQPQSADTPVDPSRGSMGAPAGATLPPTTDKPAQLPSSAGGTVPMAATAPASDIPASPASQ